MIPTSKLRLDQNNIKVHTDTQIAGLVEIMKLVGFTDPVMIDKKFNVRAGKGSVLAAMKLGMDEVPCLYLDNMTEKEIKAFMLMDNRINESTWDKEEVKSILDSIPNFDFEKFHMTFDEFKLEPEASVKDVSFQATKHECPKCHFKF